MKSSITTASPLTSRMSRAGQRSPRSVELKRNRPIVLAIRHDGVDRCRLLRRA